MNVLMIGTKDKKELEMYMQETYNEPLQFYYTDSIEEAPKNIVNLLIQLFVCDLKYTDTQVRNLVDSIGDFMFSPTRGIFIHDEKEDFLAIYGLNSYIIKDYILRPYDEERVSEMWRHCQQDKFVDF